MANNVWIGGTSTAFGTAANWLTGSAPTTGDSVTIDGRAQNDLAGSDQSAITLAALRIYKSCTKNIGTNSAGTVTPLKIGATICEIGLDGEGGNASSGPPSCIIDFSSIQTTCTVHSARANGTSGFSCVVLRGTHASNKLVVKGGSVGVGTITPAEASTISQLDVSGKADVTLGYGLTLTTINQTGGAISLASAVTTINQDGGTLTTKGSGAIATANMGGTLVANSTGTITTLNVSGSGSADFAQSPEARTVSNAFIYGSGSSINADNGASLSVTFTTGVDCLQGAKTSQVNFGDSVTVTPSAL